MSDLEQELAVAASMARKYARRNYRFAYLVSIVTVVSSIAAGIVVGAGVHFLEPWGKAALASLPAAMVTVSTVFRFEQKSSWFWHKTKRLEALLRSLKYESAVAVDASKAFSKVEADMESEWIAFGASASNGSKD
jgi:peptidoglycan biosynthesis protein MviN/MurJ (putative lipid II flippase)